MSAWSRTHLMRCAIALALALAAAACAPEPRPQPVAIPQAPQQPQRLAFEATAYSIEGKTASGRRAREGIVAADPKYLPLDTRIRVHGAGPYSGEYVVADTGRQIRGREIDIYIASDREAKRFGRRDVEVEILEPAQYADR